MLPGRHLRPRVSFALFEGGAVYRVQGTGTYLLPMEAIGSDGRGMNPAAGGDYSQLPWRLGLLTRTNTSC
ncbi:hypothetical protein [Streptomyces botrytidirepellens]|uniref:hypothetical protein n=1 Tax=Streptomyces botrytidirepellens TaxID=2486417 RepID=UPI0016135B42